MNAVSTFKKIGENDYGCQDKNYKLCYFASKPFTCSKEFAH